MTLIINRIVTCGWPQYEISLTHQIILTVLILFYHIQVNVTVSVTYKPILANRSRRRRICTGVKLLSDFKSVTYCSIFLTSIWNINNTSNKFNRANSFLSYTRQRNCQCDLLSHLSQLAEKPLHTSGGKIVGDFNNHTYCSKRLTTIWIIIYTSN